MKLKNILNYSQPNFYAFSEDSLELIQFAKGVISGDREGLSFLDMGAGCGVLGIEAALNIPNISKVTFLELQKEFIPHLKKNIKEANLATTRIYQNSFKEQNFGEEKFDLIFSNPPYFFPGEGRASPNINRQICRSFEVDGFSTFFNRLKLWLKDDGMAFICLREVNPVSSYLENFEIIEKKELKGAHLICLSRLNED